MESDGGAGLAPPVLSDAVARFTPPDRLVVRRDVKKRRPHRDERYGKTRVSVLQLSLLDNVRRDGCGMETTRSPAYHYHKRTNDAEERWSTMALIRTFHNGHVFVVITDYELQKSWTDF